MPVRAVSLTQSSTTPYESDFNAWCRETAALIRERRWSEIDAEHLAEEIEALANRDERELDSRLTVLLMHLLKWHVQSRLRGPSWRSTIREQRRQIGLMLRSSPSLRRVLAGAWTEVYRNAVAGAVDETGVGQESFPVECPWTPDHALDPDFYPEPAK
jgi:Domain of unknown function DUF29